MSSEDKTQQDVAAAFDEAGIAYVREYQLDAGSRIDFWLPQKIGIEVKIRGGKMQIFRQCERYCGFDQIDQLVLVTNVPTGFPKEVNGKPVYVLNLAKAWL